MHTIEIGGIKRPLVFGLKVFNDYAKERDIPFSEAIGSIDPEKDLSPIVDLLHLAINEAARRNESDEITKDEVWKAVDEDPSILLQATTFITESVQVMTSKLGNFTHPATPKSPGKKTKQSR